jgi:tetratricopeptide (TPR) repeat protein
MSPRVFLLSVLSLVGCSTIQSPSPTDVQLVIARGEAKQALTEMAASAAMAEQNREWDVAASFYNEASRAALFTGELQKAISYASKGYELAGRTKDPMAQVFAVRYLARVYWDLKQYDSAREWINKGIDLLKQLQPGLRKDGFEAFLYRSLGQDYSRRGETQKAIESLSYSLQTYESRLSNFSRIRGKLQPGALDVIVGQTVSTLSQLAQVYEKLGNIDEALKANQKGIDLITQFNAKTVNGGSNLYQNIGRLYLSQRDLARARENFETALAFAKSTRRCR